MDNNKKLPLDVFFISHGSPSFLYGEEEKGAYDTVKRLGKNVLDSSKIKGVIVLSAHWQANEDENEKNIFENEKNIFENKNKYLIKISCAPNGEENKLIYDFYGFPDKLYKEKFSTTGNLQLAQKISTLLQEKQKFNTLITVPQRGFDHGLWAPLKVMFDSDNINKKNNKKFNTLLGDIPVIQISEPSSNIRLENDPISYAEAFLSLGEILSPLREEGFLIIGSGMTVHNLRDMFYSSPNSKFSYTSSFDNALKDAIINSKNYIQRKKNLINILNRKDLREAHPTLEHLMPIFFTVGAAGNSIPKQEYTSQDGSLAWGMYSFGK